MAKKVGVCAEPEILHWDLTENDRFAIVASDGVFEFITSQNVVDMIAKFEDPIEGALFCRCVDLFFCDVYDNLVQRCCMHSLILSFFISVGIRITHSFLQLILLQFDHGSFFFLLIRRQARGGRSLPSVADL